MALGACLCGAVSQLLVHMIWTEQHNLRNQVGGNIKDHMRCYFLGRQKMVFASFNFKTFRSYI